MAWEILPEDVHRTDCRTDLVKEEAGNTSHDERDQGIGRHLLAAPIMPQDNNLDQRKGRVYEKASLSKHRYGGEPLPDQEASLPSQQSVEPEEMKIKNARLQRDGCVECKIRDDYEHRTERRE